MNNGNNNIQRFVDAQNTGYAHGRNYSTAFAEMQRGKKGVDWIWYVFPQIGGLGRTAINKHFSITSLGEAKEYLQDDALRTKYIDVLKVLHVHKDSKALREIFGGDDVKVVSSMTLFYRVAKELSEKGNVQCKEMVTLIDDIQRGTKTRFDWCKKTNNTLNAWLNEEKIPLKPSKEKALPVSQRGQEKIPKQKKKVRFADEELDKIKVILKELQDSTGLKLQDIKSIFVDAQTKGGYTLQGLPADNDEHKFQFSVDFQKKCGERELFFSNTSGRNDFGMRTKSFIDFLAKKDITLDAILNDAGLAK